MTKILIYHEKSIQRVDDSLFYHAVLSPPVDLLKKNQQIKNSYLNEIQKNQFNFVSSLLWNLLVCPTIIENRLVFKTIITIALDRNAKFQT